MIPLASPSMLPHIHPLPGDTWEEVMAAAWPLQPRDTLWTNSITTSPRGRRPCRSMQVWLGPSLPGYLSWNF